MTIVTGFNDGYFALLSADSRLSARGRPDRYDQCQKVFAIGSRTVVGFAGDLDAIADVLASLIQIEATDSQAVSVERIQNELPRILRTGWKAFCRLLGRTNVALDIVVAGRMAADSVTMFHIGSPDFTVKVVPPGSHVVIGSGAPAVKRFGDQLSSVISEQKAWFESIGIDAETVLACSMGNILDSYLRKSGIDTVGRVFHTMLLNSTGIWAVPYKIKPPGSHLSIGTRCGADKRWIQFRSDGEEIPLLSPLEIRMRPDALSQPWTLSGFLGDRSTEG